MDNKKFEKLIDLIINENEEQARELFHDIVVEKSREIYESIMDDEMMGEGGMVGQVGDLMDEINAEEAGGMTEADEEMEFDADDGEGDDEIIDIDADDVGDDEAGEVEDAVIRIEDKLDQLMAEFEEIMGGDNMGDDDMGDDDMGDEEDFGGDEEMMEAEEIDEEDDDLEESVMEAIQLKQIGGQTYNSYGKMGDNGAQTKSPSLQNSGQAGMDSKPVKFSGQSESVPNSPKAPSNYGSKGETQVKGAGQFKNAPAQKTQDLEKAPVPTKSQASGVNTKSPVSESRKIVKKRI
jgi:hypothetical protein